MTPQPLRSPAPSPHDPSPFAGLESLLLQAPALIARTVGPRHVYTFVNQRCEEVVGRTGLVGLDVRTAFPELEGQPFFDLLDGVYRTGEPFVGREIPARWLKNGVETEGYFTFTYQPVRDAAGQVDGILIHAVEVTDLVREREAAREAEQRFRDLVNGLPDAIVWEADAATVDFLFVSPSAEQLLGYPVQAWYDEKPNFWVNHLHPEDRERSVSFCLNETAQGRDHQFEYRMIAKDGRTVWLHDRAYVVRDANGKIARLRGIMVDITRLKEADAAIRQLNTELERRVEDRTRDLREAMGELEAFAYTVSHDLRAPFRHISGFTELLVKTAGAKLDATERRYVDTIAGAAQRAGQLVDHLLAFSRMGRLPLDERPVDLAVLVDEVRREVELDAPGRTIAWRIDRLPVVRGDVQLLRVAFKNLLANAMKFTAGREPARVEVNATTTGDEVCVHVEDNGAGFDPAHADKLFGVFQRLHREDEFEGTGIGLATVKRIVQRHGGRVWAEGAPGRGARFSLSLPLSEVRP